MLDVKITFKGGKNLSKVDFQSIPYLKEVLPWAAARIKNRVLTRGASGDGRPLPPYSLRTKRILVKLGDNPDKVDYDRGGQMWRSLMYTIDSKGHGVVGFSGSRREKRASGWGTTKSVLRYRRKDGTVKERSLTNQLLATLLAFREPRRPMPTRSMAFVPRGSFMDLDDEGVQEVTRRYEKYLRQKLDAAPPAI